MILQQECPRLQDAVRVWACGDCAAKKSLFAGSSLQQRGPVTLAAVEWQRARCVMGQGLGPGLKGGLGGGGVAAKDCAKNCGVCSAESARLQAPITLDAAERACHCVLGRWLQDEQPQHLTASEK
jgi:hypothetical protein